MPKKLPLPDYSDVHRVRGSEHFTRDKAQALATRFSFKPDYGLYENLNDAAAWLDIFHPSSGVQREKEKQAERKGVKGYRAGIGDAAPTVRRQEFEALQARGKDFLESLRKLGHHACVDLVMNDPKVPQGCVDLEKLELEVQILLWATRKALAALPDAKAGRPAKDVEVLFAACVREIYLEGTGRDDTPKHDRENDTYSGDFFEFFKVCMETVGLRKGDEQLSRLAGEVCRKTRKSVGPIITE